MEITVPTSWNDVTVNQYQALTQIDKESYPNDLAYTVAVLQVLCNLDNMTTIPLSAMQELAPSISFLAKEPNKERYNDVSYNDVSYEWIESFNAITVGEAISIELIIDLEELTFASSYDVVLAVMLREKGKKFNAKEFNRNRDLFGGLPITEVLGQLLFFLNGGQTSTAHLKTYSITRSLMITSRKKNLKKWSKAKKLLKQISGLR
jgi:hypothetical protein